MFSIRIHPFDHLNGQKYSNSHPATTSDPTEPILSEHEHYDVECWRNTGSTEV